MQQIEGCERLTHTPFYVSEKALVQSWIRAFVLSGELFIFRYKYVLTLRQLTLTRLSGFSSLDKLFYFFSSKISNVGRFYGGLNGL